MATNTSKTNTNTNTNTEARKHYYIALLDTSTNEVRFAPNTIKGRKTLAEMQNKNTKAYKVGAKNIDDAFTVFCKNTGIDCTLVKIVYKKNIPEVKEIEL